MIALLYVFTSLGWADWTVINITDGITVSQKPCPIVICLPFVEKAPSMFISPNYRAFSLMKNEVLNGLILWKVYPQMIGRMKKESSTKNMISPGPFKTEIMSCHKRMIDGNTKTVTASYQSVDSPLKPTQECCIRAYAQRTYWSLIALPDGKTQVAVEVQTDQGCPPGLVDQHDSKRLALQFNHKSFSTSQKRQHQSRIFDHWLVSS